MSENLFAYTAQIPVIPKVLQVLSMASVLPLLRLCLL